MSKKIFGNENNIKSFKIKNNDVKTIEVPVDIDSYLNRKTESQTINLYLKARNGFDRGLWQPPLVAELPNGKRYLFDGDHRRKLWTLAYPKNIKMPVQIVQVKDKQEISRLFVAINKTARKALKANEVFVHEVLGGMGNAKNTAAILKQCGLSVSLGTDEAGSVVGDPTGPQVSIIGFKQGVNEVGKDPMIYASKVLKEIFPADKNIRIEILRAISKLRKNVPELESKFDKEFQNIMTQLGATLVKQKYVSSKLKQDGGSKVNQDEDSITYGLIKHLKTHASVSKFGSSPTFRKYFGQYEQQLKEDLS